jgi:hypothetical protein
MAAALAAIDAARARGHGYSAYNGHRLAPEVANVLIRAADADPDGDHALANWADAMRAQTAVVQSAVQTVQTVEREHEAEQSKALTVASQGPSLSVN